jgi:hypothetical protein
MKMGGRRNQMGGKILEMTIDRKREKSIPVSTNSNTQSNSFHWHHSRNLHNID